MEVQSLAVQGKKSRKASIIWMRMLYKDAVSIESRQVTKSSDFFVLKN